jgi:hypothetical protein
MRTILCFILPLLAGALRATSPVLYKPKEVVIRDSAPPFEKFDPFQLSEDDTRLVFYREAELKHGRIAMIASTTIPLVEQFTHKACIHEFDNLPTNVKLLIVGTMFMSEFSSMFRGWENPTEKPFTLRSGYQPGDYGFSTIDLTAENSGELLDKELNNGRLAMIGALGMITQELATNAPLF